MSAALKKNRNKRQRVCATDEFSKFTNSSCVPKKLAMVPRWTEKVFCSYIPSVAFSYEVTFPSPIIKYIKLKIQQLLSSNLTYCAITEVKTFLTEVLQPGDILLKINDSPLLSERNGDGIFDNSTVANLLTNCTLPCTLRIMRTGGTSTNFKPSPCEILLLESDKSCTAKFVVNIPAKHKEAAGEALIHKDSISGGPSIELRYLDQQAPWAIKQMMQGQKIQWDYLAVTTNPVSSTTDIMKTVDKSSFPSFVYVPDVATSYSAQSAIHGYRDDDGLIRGGLFRERTRWGAFIAEKLSRGGIMEQVHNLGKYDSEYEAKVAYMKAAEMVKSCGYFSHQRFSEVLAAASSQRSIQAVGATASAYSVTTTAPTPALGGGSNVTANSSLLETTQSAWTTSTSSNA